MREPLSAQREAGEAAIISIGGLVHLTRIAATTYILDLAGDAYYQAPGAVFDIVRGGGRDARTPEAPAALSGLPERLHAAMKGAPPILSRPKPVQRGAIAASAECGADRDAQDWRSAIGVLAACAVASGLLAVRPLAAIVSSVRTRKARVLDATHAETAIVEASRAFRRWRPLVPRPYRCLFDTLALIEFLAARGLGADWVFAVRADPFAAHCWAQAGVVALDAAVEEARRFQPIMVA